MPLRRTRSQGEASVRHRFLLVVAVVALAGVANPLEPRSALSTGGPEELLLNNPPVPGRVLDGPNVLLIVTDDERTSRLTTMPKMSQWFGNGGVTYSNAYVTTPLCCPARASIFSGRYMHNHGVVSNVTSRFLDQDLTVQRYLHDAGYFTGLYGKFFNVPREPLHFDDWVVSTRFPYYDGTWFEDGMTFEVPTYSTRYLGDRATQFLADAELAEDARPWFLYIAPVAPHAPYVPEDKYAGTVVGAWNGNPAVRERNKSDKPPYVREKPRRLGRGRQTRAGQLRTLMSVDDMVGRVARALRRLEEDRETLVIYVSDNGFTWGEHGLVNKTVPYTSSIKVPMYMRWPGKLPSGKTDDRFVTNVDLAPTILDATDMRTDKVHTLDGRSLLRPWERDHVFTEYESFKWDTPTWRSVRTRSHQYIEYLGDEGKRIFRELYDLRTDPWQLTNVLEDRSRKNDPPRALVRDLRARLRAGAGCRGRTCP